MKNLLLIFFTIMSFLTFGQVTLLSPTGDGGFETGTTAAANGWTGTNGGNATRNQWIVGSTYSWGGSRGAYITNATGSTPPPNAYTKNATRVTHLYRNFTIPTNAATATLSFYWKGIGETYLGTPTDYMSVYFEPATNAAPVYGTQKSFSGTAPTGIVNAATASSAPTTRTRYNLQSTSQLVTINIPIVYFTNTAYRLTFEWRNDGSAGTNPPAAIDNVSITYTVVSSSPTCASLSAPSNGATGRPLNQVISWAATATATGYDVYFGTSATPPLVSSNQAGTSYTPTLAGGTTYYFKIVPKNGVGYASGCNTWSFTTLSPPSNDACSAATSLPCGTSSLAGTTVNSVSETAPLGYSSNFGVWYTFTGDGQQTTITSTTTFDHELDIMTGSSCGSFTIVSAVDNSTGTETYTFTTTNGQQYYIYVAHYSTLGTSSNTGTFTISRTCTAPPTPPANDACSAATSLPCATSNLAGTTVNSVSETAPGGGLASKFGVWYTFTGDGGQTTVSATGNSFDIEMTIVQGTCGSNTLVTSQDNAGGTGTETYTFTTTNSTVYYVYIAHWSSSGTSSNVGTFTISRTCVVPCTTPTTAGTLTASKTSTTVNDAVVFTTSGNGGSITKFEWSYDDFTTVAGTTNNPANPYTLIINVQQPTMYFRTTSVSGLCPAGVTSAVSVTLQSAPPYVYGTEDGDHISNVTLNTINNNSTYDSPLGDSYQDFTSLSTTLTQGANYTISVSSPMTYSNYSGYVAWIDFDNDGVFETTETIMQQAPGATRSQSFTVPSTASTSLVTLRVLSSWSETPSTDAYYSIGYDWGEIEEYKINITSALPIELSTFNGINKGQDNYLFWVTSSEQNTSHFNLQKSRDGETWTTITTLNAAGNSTNQIDYDVVDYKVEPIINYYRLQQYDNDGVYETFGPISINNMDLGSQKTIVKYINLNGQEIDPNRLNLMDVYIEVYDDGTMRKVIK
jgi:hypothetical protein